MKELSIEEKAERYDEIIIEFKPIYDLAKEQGRIIDVEEFERIFPELKESEDEDDKMRKAIHIYLDWLDGRKDYQPKGDYTIRDMIAWLEKQGEKVTAIEGFSTEFEKQVSYLIASAINKEHEYNEGFVKWIANALLKYAKHELEKQSEQDDNEDSNILQRFSFYSYKDEPNILYLAGLYVNDEYRNKGIGTKILKIADEVAVSMKCSSILLKTEIGSNAERLYKNNGYSVFRREENQVWLEKQGQKNLANSAKTCKDWQNPAWSEEDEEIYQSIIDDTVQENQLNDKQTNWIRDIKYRYFPQPKQGWSKEDERIYRSITYSFAHNFPLTIQQQEFVKSLKDRYTWRPSDEQMNALSNALSLAKNCGEEWGFDLRTLYEQLKKLKG